MTELPLHLHVLRRLAASERAAVDQAQLRALHCAVEGTNRALALALARAEGADVEATPMLDEGADSLDALRAAALAANAALRAFLAPPSATPPASSARDGALSAFSASSAPSTASRSSSAFNLAALPPPTAAAPAPAPSGQPSAGCLGGAGNQGLVLPVLFVLLSCALLVARVAVDSSRVGGLPGGGSGRDALRALPSPAPAALEWSTGACRDPKWGDSEVVNVTTVINPIHPRVPWTYGNTYGARGDRFFAIRHVLDTYCDNFGRFIVTRTNNRDVAASPYVLTQFYWDVPDTLAKAGLAHTTPVYFFIDTNMEGALAHWLGESGAFLPLWEGLRAQFPALKLMLPPAPKSFKWETLALYGIGAEHVIFGPPFPHPCSNLVLFPPLILYNQWDTDLAMVRRVWGTQAEFFRRASGLGRCAPGRRAAPRLLLMPRGSKENFAQNEASQAGARRNESEEGVLWARAQAELGASVFSTDAAPDLPTQVRAVDGASCIVLIYGSAMFFNEALARNATVIALGDLGHHDIMNTFRAIHDYAQAFNRVIIVPKPYTAEQVLALARAAMGSAAQGAGTFPLDLPCE